MSKVKTVAVFADFKIGDQEPSTSFEYGTFGKNEKYETAADFIDSVRAMFRSAKAKFKITNVVIG